MSEDSTSVANATDAANTASDTKRTSKRAPKTPNTLDGIARAMLRARGIKSDERLAEQKKILRGKLRGAYWSQLTKEAPKMYGPRGTVKREPNDRRPWGTIPSGVARALIKNAR